MDIGRIGGLIPPLTTPFDARGDLCEADLAETIRLLEADVDGFLVLGSNGEAVFLTEPERDRALAAARSAIPDDKPMLAGTGGEATRQVAERTRRAADQGADAALVLPPHYYLGAMTEAALERHFVAVADASPIPLLLYNIPQATTLRLEPALIGRLSTHPHIVGVKDSSGNVGGMIETKRLAEPQFVLFTGHAPTLLAALAVGANGGILAVANLAAERYQQLLTAFADGDLERARELQLRLNPLAQAVTVGYGVAGLKAALRLRGRPAGLPREPLADVGAEVTAELAGLLTELGLEAEASS